MTQRNLPLRERLFLKIDVRGPDDCWEWQAHRAHFGHGHVRVNGRTELAHRMVWQEEVGPIPAGLFVLHHCDNPPCCNPAHLFLGTQQDNIADMCAKGRDRHPTGAANGRSLLRRLAA